MSWHIRAACAADLPALLALAEMTGGGFTNLPADAKALGERLAWSDESFARAEEAPHDELYILLLEQAASPGDGASGAGTRDSASGAGTRDSASGATGDAASGAGRIGGCAMVFSRIGAEWPFYSYKLGVLSQTSRELGRTFALPFLSLVTDHDGCSEVGGLFLHPDLRTGGLGRLLARSRYLFIAQHRARFAAKILAELRGVLDEDGNSPFWDGLGRQFFGMAFPEADSFNAINGSQFIADLMPKHPIYTALLPESARAVIGKPHAKGEAALAMLEAEGFVFDNYVDIFDGGPTLTARTDQLRTVRESRCARVARLCQTGNGFARSLIASGELAGFRAWIGHVGGELDPADCALPAGEAAAMGIEAGEIVRHVGI